MKYFKEIAFCLGIFMIGCSGNGDKANEAINALQGAKDIVDNSKNVADRQEELKSMEPMGEEEFLAWAPKSVMGLPKKESTEKYLPLEKYRYSGYNTYYKDDDRSIQLEVFDGAGSTIYSQYAGMLSANMIIQERVDYYEKNVDRGGITVNEWHDSSSNDTGMMFIKDDRYVVSIKASGFSPDEIWKNIGEFKLDEL